MSVALGALLSARSAKLPVNKLSVARQSDPPPPKAVTAVRRT